jgi:hypothetical protein
MNLNWEGATFSPQMAWVAPVPILQPNAILTPLKTAEEAKHWRGTSDLVGDNDYMETQIHGGIEIGDIERLELGGGILLDKEVVEWLTKKAIPFHTV